ncbi:hypothetical protein KIH39_15735 [Telmatocola sphagniphila]|uniref:Uncharacterized protein n=1 Tax=Telmatocola sphagniphila TaxID=1123043 RepID=A0A8E6B4C4_9BACT|nr:hypothetical protein [Telmatocola sphagniphila]QVL30303.1 hypothetical protein KIH39_15735 [Telmatocola sphagniphila]
MFTKFHTHFLTLAALAFFTLFGGGTAGAQDEQWSPRKDSTGYTYYESGNKRAYPVGKAYFTVIDNGGGKFEFYYEEGQVFKRTPTGLWHARGGQWEAYTKEALLGGKLAEFKRHSNEAYRELLKNPANMLYQARNLAAKQMLDSAKAIAGE